MDKTIGRCSICGGAVTMPDIWMGINPPVPTCESCGATAKPRGPVIDMEPSRSPKTWLPASLTDSQGGGER